MKLGGKGKWNRKRRLEEVRYFPEDTYFLVFIKGFISVTSVSLSVGDFFFFLLAHISIGDCKME